MVEAMGLEPTNLLTANEIPRVQEGSLQAPIGALPGISIRSSSERSEKSAPVAYIVAYILTARMRGQARSEAG